jgi:hypothetical protein
VVPDGDSEAVESGTGGIGHVVLLSGAALGSAARGARSFSDVTRTSRRSYRGGEVVVKFW